jgi:hypothetical protein
MRMSTKLVAIAILFSLVPTLAAASPDAASTASTPARTGPSIRASVDALRQSPTVVLVANRPERSAKADAQSGGARGMSTAAKAAIWIAAVSIGSVWAYKTFSVTRGTD